MTAHRVAVLVTHPIQYMAPWFRALNAHPDLDVEVLFCDEAGPEEQAEAGFGVPFAWDRPLLEGYRFRILTNVARHPSVNTFRGLNTPDVGRVITAGHFDAVVINGWHYLGAWQAMVACWRRGTPMLVRGDSHLRTARHPARTLAKELLYRRFIPRFDACLSVGTWSREYFLHYGASPERVFCVPHCVEEEFFLKESEYWASQRDKLRHAWGIPLDATVYLFAGKFTPKKRPLDFVRAVGRAARDGARVFGVMAGDGPLRPSVERLTAATGSPVHLTGFLNQSEIPRAYAASDMLVLPSDGGETWGLVVNEAMVSGRACLVSDEVGSGPDLIVPEETGDFFPAGDVDSLAALMVRYAAGQENLAEMGERARQHMACFSTKVAVEGLIRALDVVHPTGTS
jgi:glycosyltransferase involved in cell wall biosynthesis